LLRLLPATVGKCAIMLNQNKFFEPNWHVLTFLHQISLCRVRYWALLEMLHRCSVCHSG
jgi:hypothetical protein